MCGRRQTATSIPRANQNDPDDSSGVLNYVVVAEGGYEFSTGNEINGISLVGVGSGTEMDYIQVHGNSDDGIEFYGGNVNVKHGVFTNNNDDSVDWDEGYQGNLQYIIVKQGASKGDPLRWTPRAPPWSCRSRPWRTSRSSMTRLLIDLQKKRSGGFFHNTVVLRSLQRPHGYLHQRRWLRL